MGRHRGVEACEPPQRLLVRIKDADEPDENVIGLAHLSLAVPDGVETGCYLFGVYSGMTTVCPRDVMLYRSSFTGW
jgi:hypothetical protein